MAPFSQLGICAEFASTASFPQIMGYTQAAKFLIFVEKISADEAMNCGFVSKILPHQSFASDAEKLIQHYGLLSSEMNLKL